MSEQVTVELRLIEQTFRLNTTEDKREELERAAELLNQKFHDMRRNAPRVEHNKLVIMVALQMGQEVPVKVLEVDRQGRVRLSIKEASAPEQAAAPAAE